VAGESHGRVRSDGRVGPGQRRHVLPGRGTVESPLLPVQRGSRRAGSVQGTEPDDPVGRPGLVQDQQLLRHVLVLVTSVHQLGRVDEHVPGVWPRRIFSHRV